MAKSWADILEDEEKAFVAALKGREEEICPELKKVGMYWLYCGKSLPALTAEQKAMAYPMKGYEHHPFFARHRTMQDVVTRCGACDYAKCGFYAGRVKH